MSSQRCAYDDHVERPPADHLAPTTGNNPDELALWYGYKSMRHLARDIPLHGRVLDLGAGISLFGEELSNYRWLRVVAVDRRYRHDALTQALVERRPKRSRHVAADATQLPFQPETFDAVFSSMMFLDLFDGPRASSAAGRIFDILKPGGFAKIGPNQPWVASKYRTSRGIPHVVTVIKTPTTSRGDFATTLVDATRLDTAGRFVEQLHLSSDHDTPEAAEVYARRLRWSRAATAAGLPSLRPSALPGRPKNPTK